MVKTVGGSSTYYYYDIAGKVSIEKNQSNVWAVGYIYLNGQMVATYKDSTTYFAHKDHLGSTRVLTKLDKSVQDNMDYLPYGEQVSGGSTTSHKFTGHERDTESGLDYMGARYYSGLSGRFTSVDPSRFSVDEIVPQTWNRYTYTRNNPLNRIDSNGKWDTPTHNWIIDTGLSMLSGADRQALKDSSKFVDSLPYQSPQWAHLHGTTMAGFGFSIGKETAMALASASIDEQLANATRLQMLWEDAGGKGYDKAALFVFGLAVHNVTDAKAHEFSNWSGLGPSIGSWGVMEGITMGANIVGALVHGAREKASGMWQRSDDSRLGEALYAARLEAIRLFKRWKEELEEERRRKAKEEEEKKKKQEEEK